MPNNEADLKDNELLDENGDAVNQDEIVNAFRELDDVKDNELEIIDDENLEKKLLDIDSDEVMLTDSLSMFFREMRQFSLLTPDREKKLVRIYKTGNTKQRKNAREVLINSNLRLVVYNAKRYMKLGIPIEDLIQEGIIGLMIGIEKFDYKTGYKLSTYVTFWIRQAITRYISNSGRLIRLPVHISEKLGKLKKVIKRYCDINGMEPSTLEIAKEMKISEQEVIELIDNSKSLLSLDTKAIDDDNNETSLYNIIGDENNISQEEHAINLEKREKLDKAISTLKEREASIIRLRYGFDDGVPKTLEEVGKIQGITRERVRQIEEKAKTKLKYKVSELKDR